MLGVDFPLGNDLAGGKVWVQPSSHGPCSRCGGCRVLLTLLVMFTHGVDCNKAGPLQEECRVDFDATVGLECPEALFHCRQQFGQAGVRLVLES